MKKIMALISVIIVLTSSVVAWAYWESSLEADMTLKLGYAVNISVQEDATSVVKPADQLAAGEVLLPIEVQPEETPSAVSEAAGLPIEPVAEPVEPVLEENEVTQPEQ